MVLATVASAWAVGLVALPFGVSQGQTTTIPAGSCESSPPSEPTLVPLPYSLGFDGEAGGLCDHAGIGTGFTWLDPPSNGDGYLASLLDITGGELHISTTSGLFERGINTQDNALGIPLDPGASYRVATTLDSAPAGTGGYEQAGLWWGNDEDNHVKLVVLSRPSNGGGPAVQLRVEDGGVPQGETAQAISGFSSTNLDLELEADSGSLTVTGRYRIGAGSWQSLGPLAVPDHFFSRDLAGTVTDTFGGIFASHRNGDQTTYRFDSFGAELIEGSEEDVSGPFQFTETNTSVPYKPTSMAWGPDDRLYVLASHGTILRYGVGAGGGLTLEASDQVLPSLPSGQTYAALGLAIDPDSTPSNITVWVSSSISGGSNFLEGVANSSTVWRLDDLNGDWTRTAMITGLPRAYENHAINNIRFHPSNGFLYIAHGGNTGAGAPNDDEDSAFGTRPEQWYSAAWLRADVKNGWSPSADGDCATTVSDSNGTSQTSPAANCSVEIVATGLRNMYDFVFHSSGDAFGADNGLGVNGTPPEATSPPCQGVVPYSQSADPGEQPDLLQRLIPGRYYGHPNPARAGGTGNPFPGECIFMDGDFQGATPHARFTEEIQILNEGNNTHSFNGMVEYGASAFGGGYAGDLVIAAFNSGAEGLYRIDPLNPGPPQLIHNLDKPLPVVEISLGRLVVGEWLTTGGSSSNLVVLTPDD